MASHSVSLWLFSVAIIHSVAFLPTATNAGPVQFVRPSTSVICASLQQPCLTFNEYVQQVDQYFGDNTTFLFLPGTHELDAQLKLVRRSNISFAPLVDKVDTHYIQLLLRPSVNITCFHCENVEIRGLVFVLSGQFDAQLQRFSIFTAELYFYNTSAFLINLTLVGNGTRLFAVCFYSDIKVNSLVVNNTKASTLYADRSTIVVFHGQNVFFNNNINSSISHGSLMQYRSNTTCYIHGNISFIENNKVLDNFGGSPLDSNHLTGAAISLRSASTIVISGKALFVRNRVITPSTGHISLVVVVQELYIQMVRLK